MYGLVLMKDTLSRSSDLLYGLHATMQDGRDIWLKACYVGSFTQRKGVLNILLSQMLCHFYKQMCSALLGV